MNKLILKIRLSVLITTLLIFYFCSYTKAQASCGLNPKTIPKHGQDGKIIEYKQTAIMDTTTCVIKGQILSLTNDTLGYATIQIKSFLNEYKIVSDFEGKFKFNHISPGIYELTVNYVGYRPLLKNNLQLSSGEVRELKIGMGYIGQDDLKQIKK